MHVFENKMMEIEFFLFISQECWENVINHRLLPDHKKGDIILPSANVFNLDKSKSLLLVAALNLSQTTNCRHPQTADDNLKFDENGETCQKG